MFELHRPGLLSNLLKEKGIQHFNSAIDFVKHLPYKRISNNSDLSFLILENCGTCSTKHAFLKKVAEEQNQNEVDLILAIYKMDAKNTPGIGSALKNSSLEYVPEAHCFIRWQGEAIDCTNPDSDLKRIESDILLEKSISPEQVGQWNAKFHKNYIQ